MNNSQVLVIHSKRVYNFGGTCVFHFVAFMHSFQKIGSDFGDFLQLCVMYFREITIDEVINCVASIPRNITTGLDQIPASTIKDSFTNILNLSLSSGKIPDVWENARVTPIHKGGDASNPSNYRPILVLPVLSKVLEKIVFNQVYDYCVRIIYLAINNMVFVLSILLQPPFYI